VEREPRVQFRIVTFEHLWKHFEGLPNTTMLAGITDEELRNEYRSSTALFLPLKEVTANNAVLESMSCGTSVVTTDKGGMSEYVHDGCANLIRPQDAEGAVDALLSLTGDRERVARMGATARAQAELFAWRRVAETMNDVYRRVLRS
jgi:glycosyltransferase involved in cell wall biosynthesis